MLLRHFVHSLTPVPALCTHFWVCSWHIFGDRTHISLPLLVSTNKWSLRCPPWVWFYIRSRLLICSKLGIVPLLRARTRLQQVPAMALTLIKALCHDPFLSPLPLVGGGMGLLPQTIYEQSAHKGPVLQLHVGECFSPLLGFHEKCFLIVPFASRVLVFLDRTHTLLMPGWGFSTFCMCGPCPCVMARACTLPIIVHDVCNK